jgi:(1->4)-alpha-D-glucan 1-alpha-D-glucosylmutase
LPGVFAESHEQIVRWIREGLADGLRVDHPDGLLDPGAYLDDLAEATGGTYVLVEKILEGDEKMPTEWKTQGTTGYDALADVDRVLIDPAGEKPLTDLDTELRGGTEQGWHDLIHTTKRSIADGILHSEVLRIDRVAAHESAAGPEAVADAIGELLTCFPVYRSYLPFGQNHLDEAAELAKKHRPDLASTIDELVPLLSDPSNAAAQRFQQTSGMVMAKGVEDTAFYRYTRLTSLTEVGADPSEFAIAVNEFHARSARRHSDYPASMTTLSTHDTKRGEDVRARIDAIAEIPEVWADGLRRLRKAAPLGDGPLENLIWQAVVGSYPASRERLQAYVEKASREAGDSTTWTEPDEKFEEKMHALIDSVFDDAEVKVIVDELVAALRDAGWSNSLSAKLIQLTAPGVPDVYQGSEFWEMSLVDPDNRRAVDFDERRTVLKRIDAGEKPAVDESGAAKLLVTTTALRLRRERPELFGDYHALAADGQAAEHVVAFDRGGAVTVATRLPLGLEKIGGWGDTTIVIGSGPVRDLITGRRFDGGSVRLADLLSDYPVALLTAATDA